MSSGKPFSLPTGFRGWSEQASIFLAEGRVMSVGQVLREDARYARLRNHPGLTESLPRTLEQARATSEAIVFVSGLALFLARRRYITLWWRIPVAVTISFSLSVTWTMIAHASAKPITVARVVAAVFACLLTVPAAAGLYAWIRHRHPSRTVGIEEILQRWRHSRIAVSEVNQGVFIGVMLGALSLLQFAALQLSRAWPDISSFYLGIANGTPLLFNDYEASADGLLAALCIGATYECITALARSERVGSIVVILSVALLYGDFTLSATALALWLTQVGLLVVLYRRWGLLAVAAAHTTSMLFVGFVVASHLSNTRFFAHSALILFVFGMFVASLTVRSHRVVTTD